MRVGTNAFGIANVCLLLWDRNWFFIIENAEREVCPPPCRNTGQKTRTVNCGRSLRARILTIERSPLETLNKIRPPYLGTGWYLWVHGTGKWGTTNDFQLLFHVTNIWDFLSSSESFFHNQPVIKFSGPTRWEICQFLLLSNPRGSSNSLILDKRREGS